VMIGTLVDIAELSVVWYGRNFNQDELRAEKGIYITINVVPIPAKRSPENSPS